MTCRSKDTSPPLAPLHVVPTKCPRPDVHASRAKARFTTQTTLPFASGPYGDAAPTHDPLLATPSIASEEFDPHSHRRSADTRTDSITVSHTRSSSGRLTSQTAGTPTGMPSRRQYRHDSGGRRPAHHHLGWGRSSAPNEPPAAQLASNAPTDKLRLSPKGTRSHFLRG